MRISLVDLRGGVCGSGFNPNTIDEPYVLVDGITVKQVDPENTSRRCSTCGFTHPDNRDSETLECLKYEYENHADYNAAKNVGLRYLRRNQTGGDGGAPLGVRLNSGTLNVNGGYSPGTTSAHSGSPR